MNWIRCYIGVLIVMFLCLVSFLMSNDLTLYKKIKIVDKKAQIAEIHQCLYDSEENVYIKCGSHVYKINKNGDFIAEIIKKGFGPDEIAMSVRMNMNVGADKLVIHDFEKQKITLFDLNGKYIRTLDIPVKKTGIMLTSNNLGDYYLFTMSKIGECQLQHLDSNFKPMKCFFPNDGIGEKTVSPPILSINIDFDLKGNIYVTDHLNYKINVFNREGDLINSFASPGKLFKKLKGNSPTNRKKYNQWRMSSSIIYLINIIEDKALIVFYRNYGKDSQIFYDLYSLNGIRFSSGALEKGIEPRGKDRQGRLVCAKADISADGTDVTWWLYIYELKPGIVK